MGLKDFILNNLRHPEVIEKIAEVVRCDLNKNYELIDNLNSPLEVLKLENNSRTLLGDYPTLQSAIEDVIEKDLLLEFNKDEIDYEM